MTKPLGRTGLLIMPPDPGRKSSHLVLLSHKGGGWYTATCMGDAKKCRAGECDHTRGLRWGDQDRRIRPVPRVDCNEPKAVISGGGRMNLSTQQKIEPILTATYGNTEMVQALAEHLATKIDGWPDVPPRYGAEYREDMVRETCWNWFSGGTTAENVARRIEEALTRETVPSDEEDS